MNATSQQIVSAHETLSMTPEEIQRELFPEMDPLVIKTILLQHSSLYQATNNRLEKAGVDADVTKEEVREFLNIIKDVARSSEVDETRAKCAKFLVNEGKGRNDAPLRAIELRSKEIAKGPTVNIFMLSKHLEQSKRALALAKERSKQLNPASPSILDVDAIPAT